MHSSNTTVHGLWIGTRLSAAELLTIKSFLACGHEFHLWAYDRLETPLPEACVLHDASAIIPRDQVFCYSASNQFGHGKGSYAGFSDIFRYKLLYEYGGWWTDMDVSCLRPLDIEDAYVFRTHQQLRLVGNIMKCPPRSELMKRCYEDASAKVHHDNTDWHLPIEILCGHVENLGLSHYIREISNPDSWNFIRNLLRSDFSPPSHWYLIHWVNEEWRRNKIDKNTALKSSYFYQLATQHQTDVEALSGFKALQQRYRLSLGGYIANRFG